MTGKSDDGASAPAADARTDTDRGRDTGATPEDERPDAPDGEMELFDLRVTIARIEGRSVCGMQVGDYFDLVNSSELRIPAGRHFCVYALQSVLPLLPAKQRQLPAADWLERDSLVCCPDPDERAVMRIERIRTRRMNSADLT